MLTNDEMYKIACEQRSDAKLVPYPDLKPEEHVQMFLKHLTIPFLELNAAGDATGDPLFDMAIHVLLGVEHVVKHRWLDKFEKENKECPGTNE